MLNVSSEQIQMLSAVAFRAALRLLLDRDQSLDIAQEALVKALSRKIDETDRLTAYVARTATNLALNRKRDATTRETALKLRAESMTSVEPVGPSELAEQRERSRLLHDALSTLASKQLDALTLRFFADMKISQIAQAMSISEGAAKTHLARGLANLKKKLTTIQGAA